MTNAQDLMSILIIIKHSNYQTIDHKSVAEYMVTPPPAVGSSKVTENTPIHSM